MTNPEDAFEAAAARPDDVEARTLMSREKIQKTVAELEQQINERTAELARVSQKLQTEIDERKRLEHELRQRMESLHESEQRFARFMQHLPGLAWIKDHAGRYVYVNDAAEQAFRVGRAEIIGKTDADIFPPETSAEFMSNDRRVLATGNGERFIETLEHDDGQAHSSIVSKFPVPGPDGSVTLVGGIAIDITDRLIAEEALKDVDRHKDEFLAMLGHELRNPLAGILNGVEVLNHFDSPHDEAVEMRGVIARQAGHMCRIVDDLLDLTRILRGKVVLKKEPVDVVSLVREVVEDHRRSIESQGSRLHVHLPGAPLWCDGDRVRLSQIISNLIANACKFMDDPGDVTIEVWSDEKRRRGLLSVRDTGVGMDASTLRQIFKPFVQAERTLDRSRGGLGLGLALVKELMELHGGRVMASSPGVGRGSQFTIEFSTQPEKESDAAAQPAAALPFIFRRVLLIDDRRDAILPAKKMLELAGHEVFTASDGPSGVALARQMLPDVILCDIGLPDGMNGYDVAHEIRSERALQATYLVAVSGYGREEDRKRSFEAGFDNHLTKPVSKANLETLMASFPRFPGSAQA